MTDYEKLVKALRCKRDDCEGCDLAFFDKDEGWMCQYAAKDDDAADAIEALQAEQKKTVTQIFCEESQKWEELCKALMVQIKELKSQLDGPIITPHDGPIITPCRGCSDYDGYGGCKSKGGCARAKMEVQK
jgi:hypothetical protein